MTLEHTDSVTEEMNITFYLLLINLNSRMWLVAAVLASAVLDHL